jgi:dTMP kinase
MFIVFDGMDRSGKSTHLKLIIKWLENQNIDLISFREPGGTLFSEKIRALLKQESSHTIDCVAQLLLFFLARHDLTKTLQNIKNTTPNKLILCDRFIDSTYAYQGHFFSNEQIDSVKNLIANIEPDFVFLFLESYGQNKDYMDEFAQENKIAIIERFKHRASLRPKNYFLVPPGDINFQHNIICKKIKEIL